MHHKEIGLLEVGGTHVEMVPVGSKIKFEKEKQRYTVQASNRYFSVCTKPFNPQKTVLYTVIDWIHGIRGTENLVFGAGAESKLDCEEMLQRLTLNRTQISHRNWCELDVEKIDLSEDKGLVDDHFIMAETLQEGDPAMVANGMVYRAIPIEEALKNL